MKSLNFTVPERSKIRVIITTDAKNEADDQFAITQALMSPKIEVVGIVAAHFHEACKLEASAHFSSNPDIDGDKTMDKSYEEICLVLEKMGLTGTCKVLHGAKHAIPNEYTPIDSEGARFIIEEAHRNGAPLYVINLGAITDLASAYLMDPTISKGIRAAIWIGGGKPPVGGWEFNLYNDIPSGNVMMDSDLEFYLLPLSSTCGIKISYAELLYKVQPYGEIGAYLCQQLFDFAETVPQPMGESWILWDMAAVALLLDDHCTQYEVINAPRFKQDMTYETVERKHSIRMYTRVEPRFTLEDFYCKLALCFGKD